MHESPEARCWQDDAVVVSTHSVTRELRQVVDCTIQNGRQEWHFSNAV